MVALLLGRRKILAAVLADVAEMPGSALPAIDWQAQESALLPVLLSRGASASDSEGPSEPLELLLEAAFTSPSMQLCHIAFSEEHLAAAAHEDS